MRNKNKNQLKIDKGFEQIFLLKKYKNDQYLYQKMPNNTNHQGNANQSTARHCLTCQNGYYQKQKDNKCSQGCGEIVTVKHCWCECKIVQLLQKTAQSFKNERTTTWLDNFTSCYTYLKETKSLPWRDYICIPMLTASQFIGTKIQKWPKCPSMNGLKKNTEYQKC